MKSIFMKMLPHIVAVIVFLVIASTFFSLLGDEYSLKQHDIQNVMGMSKEFTDYRYLTGEEGLWSNNMFGGMPAYQTSMEYPSNLLKPVDRILKLFTSPTVGAIYMCMFGFYILMLCLRVNPWLAIVAAVSFGLSSFNIIYLGAGHTSKVNAIGYMAPILGALILTYRGRVLLGSALFALFLGLHLMSNHLQMTYYLLFLLGAVGLAEMIRLIVQKQLKSALIGTGALFLAGALGLMPNMAGILTTYEYSKYTTRGATELTLVAPGRAEDQAPTNGLRPDYILEYNMAPGELWAIMIPNAKGGSSSVSIAENKEAMQKAPRTARENLAMFPQYWGEQGSSSGAFYFGAAMLFLFAMALMFSKDSLKWPFLFLSVLVIFLSMKELHGLNQFFIEKVPMYNKFRDSKMIHILLQIIVPAFGMMYVDSLLKNGVATSMRKWIWGGAGLLVFIMVMVMAKPTITGPLMSPYDIDSIDNLLTQYKSDPNSVKAINELESGLIDVRTYIFEKDAKRSLMIMLIAAGLLVAISFNKLKWYFFAGAMMVVVTVDMWSVSSRYMNEEKRKNPRTEKMEYKYYSKSEDRVLPFTPDRCDDFILQAEKGSVKDFESKVIALQEKIEESPVFVGVKDKSKFKFSAEYGVLMLNTDFRVLLANRGTFSEANVPYFHKSLGGYHAAKLKRYQELIDFYLMQEITTITDAFGTGNIESVDSALATCNAINMLNTKYVKYSGEAPPIDNSMNALGNAWFVQNIKMIPSADEEMTSIADLNPAISAVVHQEFSGIVKEPTQVDSTAFITLTEYASKILTYSSHSSTEAPAIFSEIYYPAGWVCRIDGNEVPTFRANYVLRGVMIPAGDHTVEWSFEPKTYSQGIMINWVGSFSLLFFVIAVLGLNVKQGLNEVVNTKA